MYIFIQLSLKEIISFTCTISEVGLAVPHCRLFNMCVWYSLQNV